MELSIMKKEHQVCKQHVITHTTQQVNVWYVVRWPTEMDPNQLGISRLSKQGRLQMFERRRE